MLEALERHPGVRVALHYTGPLLAWLRAERPGFLDRLAALVARGQVEIVGGGWYEPVLASLRSATGSASSSGWPTSSRRRSAVRPRGAWLAERVWEPDLPTALVDAGYQWTVLDDAHFRAAAIPEEELWGPYTTDDQGKVLTVFGTEQGLRYRIPFARSTTSSATSATTRPRPATGSGRWATTARSSAPGRRPASTAGARAAGSSASSRRSTRTPTGSRP